MRSHAGRGQLLICTSRTLFSAGAKRMLVGFGKAGRIDKARQLRISANVTGDFGNVTDLGSDAGLRGGDCRDGVVLTGWLTS